MAWIITVKNKPATIAQIAEYENTTRYPDHNNYIVRHTRSATIRDFGFYFGYDWSARSKAVDVKKIEVKK